MRGIYDEGWTPSSSPRPRRTQEAFLAVVEKRYGHREPVAYDELVRAVLATLNERVPLPKIDKMRMALGEELQALWPEAAARCGTTR